jgi:hypothetical protein
MYAQTRAATGGAGTDGQIVSGSLHIRSGKLNGKPYVALVNMSSKDVVLRGQTRDTKSEAMESFIDTVLLTSEQWRKKIEYQREQYDGTVASRET